MAAHPSLSPPTDDRSSARQRLGQSEIARWHEPFMLAVLLGSLAWAPFWFGGNDPLAWNVNIWLFGAAFIAYEAGRIIRRAAHPVPLQRLWFPVGAFLATCLWIWLQTVSWTPAALQNPVWEMLSERYGAPIPGAVSIDPGVTLQALQWLLPPGIAFWLALQLGADAERGRLLIGGIAVIVLLYSLYGVLAFKLFPATILWFPKLYYTDAVTATFVNRNSFATYAGLGLLCALSLSGHAVATAMRTAPTVGRQLAAIVSSLIGRGGVWMAILGLIAIALVLTASRGGIAGTLAGICVYGALVALRSEQGAWFRLVAVAAIIGGLLLVMLSFGDELGRRLAGSGYVDPGRLNVYRLTLLSILDSPWTGFGHGTFQYVLAMYRDATLDPRFVWDRAHNVYLELYQGLGIPMATLYLAGLAVLLGRCIFAAVMRQRSVTTPLAATACTTLILLHSMIDFSVQMQGVAITWAAILGTGVAQSWSSRERRPDRSRSRVARSSLQQYRSRHA